MRFLTRQIKELLCLIGDIAILYLALFFTLIIRYGCEWQNQWSFHFSPFSLIFVFSLAVFYALGLYDLSLARNNIYFFATLAKAVLISSISAILFFYFIPIFGITPKTNLFICFGIFAALFFIWRQFYNRFIKSPNLLNNVLILGQNEETKELVQHIKDNPQLGYRVKKILSPEDVKILFDLIETIIQEKIQVVVNSIDPQEDKNLIRNLYQCLPLKIMATDLPTFYEKITEKIPVSSIGEMWFLQNLMNDHRTVFEGIKRVSDIFFSLFIGLFVLVITPIIFLLVKIGPDCPIFSRQKKVGQDNRIFETIKFCTSQQPEKNNYQITKIGRWLRKTRLDELPQVWNVLKGEMSFVGPRPEKPEFAFSEDLFLQVPFYQVRHSVKPGLTGWAQMKYPFGTSPKDTLKKLQYDLYYIKNRSFTLDLAIILKTIKTIFSGGGK